VAAERSWQLARKWCQIRQLHVQPVASFFDSLRVKTCQFCADYAAKREKHCAACRQDLRIYGLFALSLDGFGPASFLDIAERWVQHLATVEGPNFQ